MDPIDDGRNRPRPRSPSRKRPRFDRTDALAEVLRTNGNAISIRDAVRAGEADSSFRERLVGDRWQQPYAGAYVPPHVPLDAEVLATAALKSVGAPVWLARATALWRVELLRRPPADVQLIVPNDRRLKDRPGTRIVRSRTLRGDEVTTVRGLPSTTTARALRDLCETWGLEQVLPVALDALQSRRLKLDDLREQRRRTGRGYRGAATLDALIVDLERDGSDSILEHAGRGLLDVLPYRSYPRPMPWRAPDGVIDHLDIAFPNEWVVIFCDGRTFHTTREAFTADRRAWNSVTGLWRPFWLDPRILRESPDTFVEQVAEALEDAPRDRPPAIPAQCLCRGCRTPRTPR